ncbi:hypothetical protein SJ090_17790 [Enterobacter cloacae]|uniref:HNH endonuclease n=1 Tax=Enterobacter cloacae TaxID=550 RepID=UPI0013D47F43|nr:hypothetical protein [Enterobacter cloacae]MDX7023109.1 hypothetical protein [Enterobacter cloacae]HDC4368146.1 hypothetical protein [Enterobacter cloacae]
MLRLSFPSAITSAIYNGIFSACINDIPAEEQPYKVRVSNVINQVNAEWMVYNQRALVRDLHLFQACTHGNDTQIIIGNVTKKDLKDLYEKYMVRDNMASRTVYDLLRASSNGICSLCGIAPVSTLDHYLPKARYPIFSVNPYNLVPACSTCNKGKGSAVISNRGDQTLHPFYSLQHFYNEDWLKARVTDNRPLQFEYYVDPPSQWNAFDKAVVINHFNDFKLADKYTINASQFLVYIIMDIRSILTNGSSVDVIASLSTKSQLLPKNSTMKAVIDGIILDANVCSGNFDI